MRREPSFNVGFLRSHLIQIDGIIQSVLCLIFQKLEIAGPRVGEPDIKKLTATNELWEARVKDGTGAYRMFFRFGKRNGRRIVGIAYGRKKSEQNFARSVIDLAQRRVDEYLAELGADGFGANDRGA